MKPQVLPGMFAPDVVIPVSQASRICRSRGAEKASASAATLHGQMLRIYAQGPRTDAEMASELGVERSTVNARRSELMAAGKVEAKGTRKNATSGVLNTLWGLR